MKLEEFVNKIINNPLFLKLKDVIENNAYHDRQDVYSHCITTYEIAKEQIKGDFITNNEAKKLFLDFVNEDVDRVKRKDLMMLTALMHDIGKILYYKDGNMENPLRHEGKNGNTRMPGHEYWGSTIIDKVLERVGLDNNIVVKIARVVRLHDTFNDAYLGNMANWDMEEVIDDVKSRAEGYYKECLFNIYCDVFTAKPSRYSINKIIEIFNQPSFYFPRKYFIK